MNISDDPDPRLQAVMNEVQEVLKRHDLCGIVLLANQEAGEHWINLEATWTCARLQGEAVRFQTTNLPDDAAKKAAIEGTLSMMVMLQHMAESMRRMLAGPIREIGRRFDTSTVIRDVTPPPRCG